MDGVALLGILQLVRIDVGREGASDICWGHLRALGLAEERAELVLEGNWGGEDGRALLLDHAILSDLGATTLATRGLLDLLGNTLLQSLKRLDGGNRGIALLLEDSDQARDLLLNGLGLDLSGWGSNRRGNGGSGNRGWGSGSRWLSGLLRGNNRWGGGDLDGDIGLLLNFLGGRGGGGVLAHCTSTGDVIRHD